eukprot:NODE_10_length_61504_cov_0.956502.p30 type:complete len:221 gc:universal NODE_10_length_61504_cov_0.956502:11978-11316(-)
MSAQDYNVYLEDQLNELNFKHTQLTTNYLKLSKEHQLLNEQYERQQEELVSVKLSKSMPKSRSLGSISKRSSEYLSSAEISPILNLETLLTKIERCRFKPIQHFEKDYELCLELSNVVKLELESEPYEIYHDLLIRILEAQDEANLYHFKYAQMLNEKDELFRKNYYKIENLDDRRISILNAPTVSSGQETIKTYKSTVIKAITKLGSSVTALVSATKED